MINIILMIGILTLLVSVKLFKSFLVALAFFAFVLAFAFSLFWISEKR